MAHVIDYVELVVDDLQQAKASYAKALGWTCILGVYQPLE